jgi:hypothetical protein
VPLSPGAGPGREDGRRGRGGAISGVFVWIYSCCCPLAWWMYTLNLNSSLVSLLTYIFAPVSLVGMTALLYSTIPWAALVSREISTTLIPLLIGFTSQPCLRGPSFWFFFSYSVRVLNLY